VLIQYLESLATNPACALPNTTNPTGLSLDRTVYAGCESPPALYPRPLPPD